MKIIFELSDNLICGILSGIEYKNGNYTLVSFAIETAELKDGNVITLPRKEENNA